MTHPGNLLALAVLALLFEQPMHPYEMAATLRRRRKQDSIKLRWGSLYTVIDQLVARGFIAAAETGRDGRRPERTVYRLTPQGLDELHGWMRDLVSEPAKEYPQFEAALCLLAVLPPEEAVRHLHVRAQKLASEAARLQDELDALADMNFAQVADGENVPAVMADVKFPPLFTVESEYRVAMLRAEAAFVKRLARRIDEEGWGPAAMWREMQAVLLRRHWLQDQVQPAKEQEA